MCLKVSRNMQKSSVTTRRVRLRILCLVVHIADKVVKWRRVALAKKSWKVGKGERQLLEKFGKERKNKRRVWRKG